MITESFSFTPEHLVPMKPNLAVDNKLSSKTRVFLHTIGLRNSDELVFSFTGITVLLPHQIIGFENKSGISRICLDIKQGEIIRWKDDEKMGFINSSVEQFVQCIEEFENYIENIQAKEIFGPFYSNEDARIKRIPYASYLTDKLKAIDPEIFDKGYYWPSFIEQIEQGL